MHVLARIRTTSDIAQATKTQGVVRSGARSASPHSSRFCRKLQSSCESRMDRDATDNFGPCNQRSHPHGTLVYGFRKGRAAQVSPHSAGGLNHRTRSGSAVFRNVRWHHYRILRFGGPAAGSPACLQSPKGSSQETGAPRHPLQLHWMERFVHHTLEENVFTRQGHYDVP
jgi:hypothetical protein